MTFDHNFWVGLAKSYGLFHMMIFFFAACIYAYWPKNKKKFDDAANSILTDDVEALTDET